MHGQHKSAFDVDQRNPALITLHMSASDPLITIFTAPKPFTNPHIDLIQRNAIQSWLHLGDDVNVVMIGNEPG